MSHFSALDMGIKCLVTLLLSEGRAGEAGVSLSATTSVWPVISIS